MHAHHTCRPFTALLLLALTAGHMATAVAVLVLLRLPPFVLEWLALLRLPPFVLEWLGGGAGRRRPPSLRGHSVGGQPVQHVWPRKAAVQQIHAPNRNNVQAEVGYKQVRQ